MQEIYLLDFLFVLLKILFIYFQRKGEREGEKHQCVVTSHMPPAGDLARNPGMCPDWELNRQHFDLQAGTQFTEPHQPGLPLRFSVTTNFLFWVSDPPRWRFLILVSLEFPLPPRGCTSFLEGLTQNHGIRRGHLGLFVIGLYRLPGTFVISLILIHWSL